MLRWRLLLGTLIIAALAVLCWLDTHPKGPGRWLLPVAFIAAALATGEMLDLLAAAGMRPVPWVIYSANFLLVLSGWTPWFKRFTSLQSREPDATLALDVAATAMAVFAVFISEMYRYGKHDGTMANLAGGILAILYIGLMLKFAVWLRLVYGIGALVSWIIVVKMGDTGAYALGRLIGRHKMAPSISPGKTIEGALGAFVFACLGSWLTFRWIVPFLPEGTGPGPWYGWLLFGVLVGGAGMLGDLAESLLKRDVGVKDSSTWMPGFGGVLDILDSLLLSAPVAWFCWAFGLVGR